MLQLEPTGMKCFKRTSPGELGQSPIKGERDHKAWGPHGGAKSQLIFLAAVSYLFCLILIYMSGINCTFDLQSQLITTIVVAGAPIP